MELLQYKKSKDPPSVENLSKHKPNPWLVGLMIIALGGGMSYWYAARIKTPTTESDRITNYAPVAVTALGRLEPAEEVIKLSVANAQDSRVNELLDMAAGEHLKSEYLSINPMGKVPAIESKDH